MENILTTAENIIGLNIRYVRVTFNDGITRRFRIFKSSKSGEICYVAPGRKRYGYPLPYQNIKQIIACVSIKSKEQKWQDGWKKVLVKLHESGLWTNVVEEINTALTIGYERMQKAYDDYWKMEQEAFLTLYPEFGAQNDEGKTYIQTSLLWCYAKQAKVKKMRFYPFRFYGEQNDAALQSIAVSMKQKKPCSQYGRTGYDVSFEYNPEKNRAWYSEEFKNCGNGHYYLALNATHALFVEND